MAKVLLFGPLSDVLNTEVVDIPLAEQVKTVNDLLLLLHERGKEWQIYLRAEKLQVTVIRQFGDGNTPITNSDEIALISRPGQVWPERPPPDDCVTFRTQFAKWAKLCRC